ncbi:MAG: hypothetical protein D3904_14525, partial [Candidatus Electrothrix sp. EH2]|nr:hypothetical protein [Candidatus Electrothrix sp. EH2]
RHFLHQVREEVHRLIPDAKVILHGSRVRNEARQDSDRAFLIIADHPLDREIITKLKDGLYDIELEKGAFPKSRNAFFFNTDPFFARHLDHFMELTAPEPLSQVQGSKS